MVSLTFLVKNFLAYLLDPFIFLLVVFSVIAILNLLFIFRIFFPQSRYFIFYLYHMVLIWLFIIYLYALLFWLFFNPVIVGFQFLSVRETFFFCIGFGIDGLSLFFILLTTLLTPLIVLSTSVSNKRYFSLFYFNLFVFLEFFCLGAFLTTNVFLFYLFFEMVLIPMYLLIGWFGSDKRRMLAANYLVLYTLFGSLFMLVSMLNLFFFYGTFDYYCLTLKLLPLVDQMVLWPGFFLAFAIKIPMFPFHLWLPEAHVEAPTGGSVFLAGILLKLGGYGMCRFLVPLFPDASYFYRPLVIILAVFGVLLASLAALRQIDLKRIIAYSSIAHMNMVVLGIFSFSHIGWQGAVFFMLAHGIVSSAWFFLVGILYDRYGSRFIFYFGGLVARMPIFSICLFFFCLANIGFPGTPNFIGEILLLQSIFDYSTVVFVICLVSLFINCIYTFLFFNRLVFGTQRTSVFVLVWDVTRSEWVIQFFLVVSSCFMGFCPSYFLTLFYFPVLTLFW